LAWAGIDPANGFEVAMTNGPDTGRYVVVHFRDGHVLKGTTQDFAPLKASFHLFAAGTSDARAVTVPIESLKAVFFVKSWDGDPSRKDAYDFDAASGQGRRVRVTFADGEVVDGWTLGYSREKQGFFLIPAAPDGNNVRIFVVAGATSSVEFLPAMRPTARNA
jgi:hypothetical protein